MDDLCSTDISSVVNQVSEGLLFNIGFRVVDRSSKRDLIKG